MIVGAECGERAEDVCEHSASVDVADDEDRNVRSFGETHVRDVAVAKVDLRGRPGAFAEDDVICVAQIVERIGDDAAQMGTPLVIVRGGDGPGHTTPHDYLRAVIGPGLEENRVEQCARREPASLRLESLRSPDFSAVRRHCRIVRHVLRLERRDGDPPARQGAAEPGHHHRFTGVRCCSCYEDGRRWHAATAPGRRPRSRRWGR